MKKYIIVTLLIQSTIFAFEFNFKETVTKIIGKDLSSKIFGDVEKNLLKLPVIPVINKDSKSLDVYKEIKEDITFKETELEGYNVAYIKEVVRATRNVDANRDDIAKWYNTLAQGGTREGVYRALVSDDYYRRLENYDEKLSNETKEFSIMIFAKYFNQEIKMEDLSDLNIYTLKRIMAEKALDISDAYIFAGQIEDFKVWYSILSGEFATKAKIWDNRLRSNVNPKGHLAWTKKVPVQFIKSEIVVKIHLLLNNLQTRTN